MSDYTGADRRIFEIQGIFLFKRRNGAGTLLLLGSRNQAMMSDGPVILTRPQVFQGLVLLKDARG